MSVSVSNDTWQSWYRGLGPKLEWVHSHSESFSKLHASDVSNPCFTAARIGYHLYLSGANNISWVPGGVNDPEMSKKKTQSVFVWPQMLEITRSIWGSRKKEQIMRKHFKKLSLVEINLEGKMRKRKMNNVHSPLEWLDWVFN